MEFIFDCQKYLEKKRVKIFIVKFINYVIVWWDQLILSKKRNH